MFWDIILQKRLKPHTQCWLSGFCFHIDGNNFYICFLSDTDLKIEDKIRQKAKTGQSETLSSTVNGKTTGVQQQKPASSQVNTFYKQAIVVSYLIHNPEHNPTLNTSWKYIAKYSHKNEMATKFPWTTFPISIQYTQFSDKDMTFSLFLCH